MFARLPESVLFDTLRMLTVQDLGASIVALGPHFTKAPQGQLASLVDEALVSNMRRFSTEHVDNRGHYGYVVLNDYCFDGALPQTNTGVMRAAFPFEARLRYFAARSELVEELSTRDAPFSAPFDRLLSPDGLYVHDLCVFESGMRSEKCMLLSLPALALDPRRVLFLVSLGIRNDCDWGCFCVGRHCIAVDVLLPESDSFECLWLYDQCTSGDDGPGSRHVSNECENLDAATRRRINRAFGLEEREGDDLYFVVRTLSFLCGSDGRHYDAFGRFLHERAKYAKWEAKEEAKADVEEEDDDPLDYDPEEDEMVDFDGELKCEVDFDDPAVFQYPAAPEATILPQFGRYFGGDPEIRSQLHDWLPTIARTSLGAVVAATQGFGARFTNDHFEREEQRMNREIEEEEAHAERKEALAAREAADRLAHAAKLRVAKVLDECAALEE